MGVTCNINGLSLCHVGSGGSSTSTLPDVCLTPSGPVPVPYVNTSFSSDLANGTATVFADGGNMCAINGSEFSVSVGDEPGTAGGVCSGVNRDKSEWVTFSPNVKMEGAEVCRLTDLKTQNQANTANMAGEIQGPLPSANLDENGDCEAGDGESYDGKYVGSDGKGGCAVYENATDPSEVPKVTPSNGAQGGGDIVYVNGINTDPCAHCKTLQELADHKCANVVGIYNNSDIWEAAADKFNKGDGKAVDTLSALIEKNNGEGLHIVAHSHGGLVTSRALTQAANSGTALGSGLNVETFGAASYTYPSGPTYSHTVNLFDIVPMLTGKGAVAVLAPFAAGLALGLTTPAAVIATLGLASKIAPNTKFITSWKTFLGHSIEEDYLPTSPKTYC